MNHEFELTHLAKLKELLTRHGFTFSKSLGQNFLINPNICPQMAESSVISDNCGVLEIGPGVGVLTKELAKRAKKVVAIELDKRLIPVLSETLCNYDNIKIIEGDALKLDLLSLIEENFKGMDVTVCANLPYYITSPVIMKILESKIPVKSLTVMVQKEAAERLCTEVGTRASGAVTVSVAYYAKAKILFSVPRGNFMPAPNVDSAVISLEILEKPQVAVKNEEMFFKTIKAAFSQRRKTISNSLSSGLSLPKEKIMEILATAKVDPSSRAEKLTLEDFKAISDNI